jgi:hypothetical protein
MQGNYFRKIFSLFIIALLTLLVILVLGGCLHPGPNFPIENGFTQAVIIYFNGVKVGKLKPETSKIFYPHEVFYDEANLLLEAKSYSGTLLYSREFTWDELTTVISNLKGIRSYRISADVSP